MKFVAEINVMPLKALLDPQGKAVTSTLKTSGYKAVNNVRIGKHITLEIEAATKSDAENMVNEISKKVLINPIMEDYEFVLNNL